MEKLVTKYKNSPHNTKTLNFAEIGFVFWCLCLESFSFCMWV